MLIDGAAHTVQGARIQGGIVLLKLADVADRGAAATFRNKEVVIPREDAGALPKGQFYWHQVIGLSVEDSTTGEVLGTVRDILETGANDVYVVKTDTGKEILVPAIKDVIKRISPEEGRMLIAPLPGMIAP